MFNPSDERGGGDRRTQRKTNRLRGRAGEETDRRMNVYRLKQRGDSREDERQRQPYRLTDIGTT